MPIIQDLLALEKPCSVARSNITKGYTDSFGCFRTHSRFQLDFACIGRVR